MADFNPNQVLPGNVKRVSVTELTKQLEEANNQAKELAKRANAVYRKMHPDDDLKTEIYEMKDFLNKDNSVFVPEEVDEMFKAYEEMKAEKREAEDKAKYENAESKPSVTQLKEAISDKSVMKDEEVKKNPILSKLLNSFGLADNSHPKTVKKTIKDIEYTFEYPSSLTADFTLAFASSEAFGSLDFGFTMQLITLGLSVVEIDGVPVTTALGLTDQYKHYTEIPDRIRKVCGVKMAKFFNAISPADFNLFKSFYDYEIGFNNEKADIDSKEFVELECPKCHRTEVVPVVDGKVPNRWCSFDGTKMEAQSSNKTDENAPLE